MPGAVAAAPVRAAAHAATRRVLGLERRDDRIDDVGGARHRGPTTSLTVVTPASVMPHGMIPRKPASVLSQLRAKPCIVTPCCDAHADRGDLVLGERPAHPHAAAALDPVAVDAVLGEHVDEQPLEAAHVRDDVDGLGQAHDRVADELARAVPRDLAAAVDVDDGRAVGRPLVRLGALARPCRPPRARGGSACRDGRRRRRRRGPAAAAPSRRGRGRSRGRVRRSGTSSMGSFASRIGDFWIASNNTLVVRPGARRAPARTLWG